MIYWLRQDLAAKLEKDPEAIVREIDAPQSSDDHFGLALAFERLGKSSQSERHLKEALRKNLGHIPSAYVMGLRAFARNKDAEGRSYIRRALRMDPKAEEVASSFIRDIKGALHHSPRATDICIWFLKELAELEKANESSAFHLGKLLFEKSQYEEAVKHLIEALDEPELAGEATEYLSYIYEHLYRGDELITKTLELAELVRDRSDLFFNLAMVCQHDQRKLELALHFFYLASNEDPSDPGLKFSLEQAAIELMNQVQRTETEDRDFLLMIAHLYQGALGVAKRYAQNIKSLKYPEDLSKREPYGLWQHWLLKEGSLLTKALDSWFGSGPKAKKLHSLTQI